jgi:hypothetical protein
MDISFTYVYKLIKEEDNSIFYIGKTNDPFRRFHTHRANGSFVNLKFYMVLIEKYIDKEDELINKFLSEGHNLLNVRKNDYILKEYNIGDELKYDPYLKINKMFKK